MPAKPTQTRASLNWFDPLPDAALIREQQIIPSHENQSPLINVSPSTWWRWVRANKAPQPIKLSEGVTVWRVGDMRRWLATLAPGRQA